MKTTRIVHAVAHARGVLLFPERGRTTFLNYNAPAPRAWENQRPHERTLTPAPAFFIPVLPPTFTLKHA